MSGPLKSHHQAKTLVTENKMKTKSISHRRNTCFTNGVQMLQFNMG